MVEIEETNAINSRREAPIYPASFGIDTMSSDDKAINKVASRSEVSLVVILIPFCVGVIAYNYNTA